MTLQNGKSKEMSLNLSSDAKSRLKWTPELHKRFVDAVDQLGGAEKATPKSLMRIMGIDGLTLYHLKSHLQKYRLGRSHLPKTSNQDKLEEYGETHSHVNIKIYDGAKEQIEESMQMAGALQMQVEVQRKLHEHIEVQRHLQRRIEAQGKYLQFLLKKAQETLSGYSSCSIEVEQARVQLSQLVSMVESGYSLDGSLTSSQSSGRKEETPPKQELEKNCMVDNGNKWKRNSIVLSLMERHPAGKNGAEGEDNKKNSKRNTEELKIDLNCKSMNDFDFGSKLIDLNSKGVEP